MAAEAKLNVKITGDSSQAKTEVQGFAKAASVAFTQVAATVQSAESSVKRFQQTVNAVAGFWGRIVVAVNTTIDLVGKLVRAWNDAGRATEEYARTAQDAMDEAKDAGGDGALFAALEDAAGKAGVSADEFAEKLRQFKEHTITFDELAASIGSTRDALLGAADAADPANAGLRYLADKRGAEAEAKAAADRTKANVAGVREIVADIFRRERAGKDAGDLWDLILEAAGGDENMAKDIFMYQRSWKDRALGGADVKFGILGAKERWDARGGKSQSQIDRETAAAEATAQTESERAEKDAGAADKAARDAAEAIRRLEAAVDKAAKRRDAGKDAAGKARDQAIESIRVSAPEAVNAYARSGGLLGGESVGRALADMARERNSKLSEIQMRFDETIQKLDEGFREAIEGLAE